MAVVDDILFVRLQLYFVDRPEAVQDQLAGPADLQDKKPFAAQQAARETLHLALDLHSFRAGQKPILLHHVFIHAVEIQQDNFTGHGRGQEHFPRSTAGAERLEEKLLAAEHLP